MPDKIAKKRSDTMPTTSTTSSSSSIKSRRCLVYDMAEISTRKMSRDEFDTIYSKVAPEYISVIPLPKGASHIDISQDDLRSRSPEPISSEDHSPVESRPKSRTSSLIANVHIPGSVFWPRALGSTRYTELIVISRPRKNNNNSQKSSRSNTTWTNVSQEE